MGFEYAELSHGIRLSLLPGIYQAVEAGEIKISSVHNFCPLPIGITHANPNLFKFTSPDRRERENALRYSMKTLETAERVRAQFVVIHLGALPIKDFTDRMLAIVGEGQKDSPKYEKLCQEVIILRERKKGKYLDYAYEILRQIEAEAERRGLRLGIENRQALEEVPLDSDFSLFLKEFTGPAIWYWHDMGHAQIKHHLGFIDHALHLEAMSARLGGLHIHDVIFPGDDHNAPGTGTIDYRRLKPWIKPEHVKVFELHPHLTAEEVKAGVAHFRRIWEEV